MANPDLRKFKRVAIPDDDDLATADLSKFKRVDIDAGPSAVGTQRRPFSPTEQFISQNVLSGQLPMALSVGGGIFGGTGGSVVPGAGTLAGATVGAGAGGLVGQNIEDIARVLLLGEQPTGALGALQSALTTGSRTALEEIAGGKLVQGLSRGVGSLGEAFGGIKVPKSGEFFDNLVRRFSPGVEEQATDIAAKEGVEAARKAGFKAQLATQKESLVGAAEEGVAAAKARATDLPLTLRSPTAGTAGENLINATTKIERELGQAVSSATKPVVNKFGKELIETPVAIDNVKNMLDDLDIIDSAGRVVDSQITKIKSPERKQLARVLSDFYQEATGGLSLRRARSIVKELDSFSKWDATDVTDEMRLFRNARRHFNDDFINGANDLAGGAAKAQIISARQQFSQFKSVIDSISKMTGVDNPANAVSSARRVLRGNALRDVVKKAPRLKQELGDVVINDIASRARTPESFLQAINDYGREGLELALSPETLKKIDGLQSKWIHAKQILTDAKKSSKASFLPGPAIPDPTFATAAEFSQVIGPLAKSVNRTLDKMASGKLVNEANAGAEILNITRAIDVWVKRQLPGAFGRGIRRGNRKRFQ
jgi:hypothetical protein